MNLADRFKEFRANPPEISDKILIFDALNTYIRAFAATPTLDSEGQHVGGITGFLLSLGATIRMFKPNRVYIVFDGAGGSQRRRALFPEYKNARRNMTRLNRTYDFATLEDEKASMQWQLKLLSEILRYLPVTTLAPDLVEADDSIAYMATVLAERNQDSIIVSTDKDFLQLVDDHISVWNPIKKKLYTPDRVVEDYGFHPTNFLMYRAITGDDSDCIPGVDGIKEKTLLKYFPEFASSLKYDMEFVFTTTERLLTEKKKPPVALQSLLAAKDTVARNIRLMRLDDVTMSGSTRLHVLEKLDSAVNEYNKMELTKTLASHKLLHAINGYEVWLQTTFGPLLRYKLGTV